MLICEYRFLRSVLACAKKNAHDRLYKKVDRREERRDGGGGRSKREKKGDIDISASCKGSKKERKTNKTMQWVCKENERKGHEFVR